MHKLKRALLPLLLLLVLLTGCETAGPARQTVIDLSALPEYSGQPYVELNGNVPFFTQEELTAGSFEEYSPGRAGPLRHGLCLHRRRPDAHRAPGRHRAGEAQRLENRKV